MQLAMFRDLRQARRQAAELTEQMTQAKKAAEQQHHEHDQARQALHESLAASRQQSALLEAALSETKTRAAAQAEADAQTADRLVAEQHRAAARIGELEEAACTAAAAHQKTVEQSQAALHEVQQQLADVDAARLTAQTRSQGLDAVTKALDAEKSRSSAILEKLARLWNSTTAEREEHERTLTEEQQRLAAERQESAALRDRLREATMTLRQQRDQLDKTALSLSMLRAAREPRVYTEKIEKLNADLLAVQKELTSRTEERDLAQAMVTVAGELFTEKCQKLAAVEKELSTQKVLEDGYQKLLAEAQVKTDRVYSQIIRIKEKRDWRL